MYKYEELAQIIEKEIRNEKYKQGEKLPSIRQLCHQYTCNKATTIKAYELLMGKHLIYAKHQSGFYVTDAIKPINNQDGYPLHSGQAMISMSSLIDAAHCLSLYTEQYAESSLESSHARKDIISHFLTTLNIDTKHENIYLIQSLTQMLFVLSMSEFPNHHQTILIEEPTYSAYIDFLKSMNLPVMTITREKNGIDLSELENLFKHHHIKFFYTIPRNHNPLGTTLDNETREKIAKLALKYNVYILEDDYFPHASQIDYFPISYYMNGKNCIYLTSFSKTLPHLNIGICVIDNAFIQTFDKIIHQSYYVQTPSLLCQATLESYIRNSLYQEHIEYLQKQFHKHHKIMKEVTKQWNKDIAYISYDYSGCYFSIFLNDSIDIDRLEDTLKQQKIYIARNEQCFYHPKQFNHSIRLSIARVTPEQLREALNVIYNIIIIDMLS